MHWFICLHIFVSENLLKEKLNGNEPDTEPFNVTQRDAAIRLSCDNWSYFRGSIHWYYYPDGTSNSAERIDPTNSLHRARFIILESDKSLVVLLRYLPDVPKDSVGVRFECWGVSIDDENDIQLLANHTQVPGKDRSDNWKL